MNQDELIFEINQLKNIGCTRNSKYINDILYHHTQIQFSHAFYFKVLNVLEFMILNFDQCKERYFKMPIQHPTNIIDSSKLTDLFFQKSSIIFHSPSFIDKIISRYQNDNNFEKYFCHVFFPTIFIGFSSKFLQDHAYHFLINYFQISNKFSSTFNHLSAAFIMSNFAFRRIFLHNYIHDFSNSLNDTPSNILIKSFFKSTFKLTSQQQSILTFYIETDEKAAMDFLLNHLLIPSIELWEFSPFFCSNTVLFRYSIPDDPNSSFDFSKKTCLLINSLISMDNNLEETIRNCFDEFQNGVQMSEESFDIFELTNGQRIGLPLTKLDLLICAQIETENSTPLNFDDCFIVYNEIEFKYDSSYFIFKDFIPKSFEFKTNDPKYQEWLTICDQADKYGIDPIDYYQQSGSNSQLIDFLHFYKQELRFSKSCRLSIKDNFRTFHRLRFEIKSMKSIMRDVYLKFIIKFIKLTNEPDIDHIMHSLFHEQIESIFLFLKSCYQSIENEEQLKGDIVAFLMPTSRKNKLDQLVLNSLNSKPIYSNFIDMFVPFFAVLKCYYFCKFIATVSCNKTDLKLTGKVSLRTRGVSKYLNKQVEEIKNVGSLQLDGLSSYGMFLIGLRILAFAFLRENVTKQFDIKNHFVEIEHEKSYSKSKSNENLAALSIEAETLNYEFKSSASIDDFQSKPNEKSNSFEKCNPNEPSSSLDKFNDRISFSNSIDTMSGLNGLLAYSNKNGSRSIDSMSAFDKSTSLVDDALNMINRDQHKTKHSRNANNSDSFDDGKNNVTETKPNMSKANKVSATEEKAAIVWEMLKKSPKKITPICKMIDGALKVITSIDDYPNEMKFWMPKKITKDIKMLTIDFGMTINK